MFKFEQHILDAAEQAGIRLEMTNGEPTWEAAPAPRHQRAVDRIRASIKSGPNPNCSCVHLPDVYVRFSDNSVKRPDISIWYEEPVEEDTAVTMLPAAVIEVVSKNYEFKDYELNPKFYLTAGVVDYVVFNPLTNEVRWYVDETKYETYQSPQQLTLRCGCEVTI